MTDINTITITNLSIEMREWARRDELPRSVFAVFSDGAHLRLDYQVTWRQCFAALRFVEMPVFIERPFRHHVTKSWAEMTDEDWISVCLAYREEMGA